MIISLSYAAIGALVFMTSYNYMKTDVKTCKLSKNSNVSRTLSIFKKKYRYDMVFYIGAGNEIYCPYVLYKDFVESRQNSYVLV